MIGNLVAVAALLLAADGGSGARMIAWKEQLAEADRLEEAHSYSQAERLLRAAAIEVERREGDSAGLVSCLWALGRNQRTQGRYIDDAATVLKRALSLSEKLGPNPDGDPADLRV